MDRRTYLAFVATGALGGKTMIRRARGRTESTPGTASRLGETSFTEQAKLVPDDGDPGDSFGEAVAVSGDTALVGARNDEDPNGSFAGSAYVFERSGGTWSQQAKLTPAEGDAEDVFGDSVSLAGDTALVGTPGASDPSGAVTGGAYVFERSGGTWSRQAKLTPDDGNEGDGVGITGALMGDTALLGAWHDDENGTDAGAAYVFERSDTTWSQQAKLTAKDGDSGDQLGIEDVALDDGTALVGAPDDDDPDAFEPGSAYVFERSGGTWSQQAKLTPDDSPTFGRFGVALDVAGDTALVGASGVSEATGAVYVFERSGGSWSQQDELTADDGKSGDHFGRGVALAGDTALIGAHREDANGRAGGAAYVFERSGGTWSQQAKLTPDDGDDRDKFGREVALDAGTALAGAFNDEDPNGEIPRGDPSENFGGAGSAYVFDRAGGGGDSPPDVTGDGTPATDPDGDGVYEDIDGDGSFDIFDVQAFLDRFGSAPVQNNSALFNFDDSGGVNIFDVQALLDEV